MTLKAVEYPIEKGTAAWKYLNDTIKELLCNYICNIINRYKGQTVEEKAIF